MQIPVMSVYVAQTVLGADSVMSCSHRKSDTSRCFYQLKGTNLLSGMSSLGKQLTFPHAGILMGPHLPTKSVSF